MNSFLIINESDLDDDYVIKIVGDRVKDYADNHVTVGNKYEVMLEYFHNQHKYWFITKQTKRFLTVKIKKALDMYSKINFI